MRLCCFARPASLVVIVITALLAGACYPGSPTAPEDRDLVSTFFDADFAFGGQRTYAMPDEVFVVEGSDEDVSDEFDAQILANVASNLAARGWVRELDPEANGADVAVVAYKTKSTRTYVFFPWWPRWPWPGWPGWGPGWGGFYPWPTVRSYSAGTIFVDMYDASSIRNDDQVRTVWSAAADGRLTGSNPDLSSDRIRRDIDQMFAQSPYLQAGR